ncbi:MAG: cobalamin B12-binding domain-containing protein [Candidatus Binataceae bacterium]
MGIAAIRVMIAKPGLDGHDRGAKVIAYALRDAGMEVVYTGLRHSPEEIVNAAMQEDVDAIGLSILSGAHVPLTRKVMAGLAALAQDKDIAVFVGGTIPDGDVAALKNMGVAGVFPTGTPLSEIVPAIKEAVATRRAASA